MALCAPRPAGTESGMKASASVPGLLRPERLTEETMRREAEALASLRIKRDIRFSAMEHYQEHGGTNAKNGHFTRLCQNTVDGADPSVVDAVKIFARIKELEEIVDPNAVAGRKKLPVFEVQDRREWQDNFERSITRLMVDFSLSDTPSCRLHHLDRMHDWFTTNGSKQTRVVQKGPSYLMATRDGPTPAGSTRNLDVRPSETSLLLAGDYAKHGSTKKPVARGNMRAPRVTMA
mmetsp:Transcript_91534/g.262150  ORF Transcript_91534/g.262150 Transcript_91534/m.262150 type:complete len:234 (-) Transcript_91534:22-723(-)